MLTNLEQWKKIVLSLPDDDFFDIMRNYLGELKTPFNKHILIEKLLSFLTRIETVERIVSLINDTDAYLLTLIHFFGEPELKILYNFVKDKKSFLEFQNIIINLEERLLIFKELDTGRIRISPIFREVLEEQILDTRLIFPSEKIEIHTASPPWFSEALIVALLSFLKNSPDLFKLDGELKKRSKEEISSTFPFLLTDTEFGSRLEIIINALTKLEIIKNDRNKFLINYDNLLDFMNFPIEKRYTLIWTAAAFNTLEIEKIFKLSAALLSFINSIPMDRGFNFTTLISLMKISAGTEELEHDWINKIVKILITTEFLYIHNEDMYALNPFFYDLLSSKVHDEPILILQPGFIVTAKPWINLETGLPLALSSNIIRYDLFTQYEIDKQSSIEIRNIGLTFDDLLDYFKQASLDKIPQNIITSFKHWADEYNSFCMYEGITLVVPDSRQVIIDHIEALKPYIKLNPAPGIYLFNKEEQKEWNSILLEAGFPTLPIIDTLSKKSKRISHFTGYHVSKNQFPEMHFIEQKSFPSRKEPVLLEELKHSLKKNNFSRTEYEDMYARINKKLILFPEQFQKALKTKEKAEVGGLDYTGKVRLIQRAVESKRDILEITSAVLPGENSRMLIKPVTISHRENNLILQAKTLPEEKELEIPIRKISYVKLLRGSLYAPVSG